MDAGAQPRQKTTILLLGQKESGKSDVGNAILGMKAFNRSSREESVILPAWAEIDTETKEYELMLIDGPDLEDIDLKKLKDKEGTCDKLGLAMGLCENGVDAFVLVLKYGVPLTEDHKVVIEAAEKMLGKEWLINNGIVVMCGGKDWYDDMEKQKRNISFEWWCRDQNDSYGNIFSKCGYRCVLFENSEPNGEHEQKLFEDLMSWAEQIREHPGRHTNEHFKAAAKNLENFINKLNDPILHIKIQKRTSLLTSKCMKLNIILAYSEKMKLIGAILDRAKVLLKDIAEENNKTEKLAKLKETVIELKKQAYQAEEDLLESPESLISDFMGIKESAKLIENIRGDPELWLNLAEVAIKGLTWFSTINLVTKGIIACVKEGSRSSDSSVNVEQDIDSFFTTAAVLVGGAVVMYGIEKYRSYRSRPVATDKPHQNITIFLLGKEATGKAAVGNAILGMEAFKRSATDCSVLPAWAEFDTETNEYELMVVGGPDVNDMNQDEEGACENLELAMSFCGHGVDLFVLVMRHNDRFTENEIFVLRYLGNMLGSEWLSQHGVVVMTYGDTSRDEMKRVSKYFAGWCTENDTSYGKYFSECKQRCFPFDIERSDERQKQTPFKELIAVAKKVKDRYGPCNNEHFAAAVKKRDSLIAHLNAPIVDLEIQKKISLLTSKNTKLSNELMYSENMKLIGAIKDRTDGLLNDISRTENGTGKLSKLKEIVTKIKVQAIQAERGLRSSPVARLSDFVDMPTYAELLEDMRRDPSRWEEFIRKAFERLKRSPRDLILAAAGLLVYAAGLIPLALHRRRK